jgi:Arc/MetJ-type ribon-helix-helix transcriptional regulator
MLQTKISLEERQIAFLSSHQQFGFRDRSALVRAALDRMQAEMERQCLEASAALYAEAYGADPDLRQLTEDALTGWPE